MLKECNSISEELKLGQYAVAGAWKKHGSLADPEWGWRTPIEDVQIQNPTRQQVSDRGHIEICADSSSNYRVESHSKAQVTLGRYLRIGWGDHKNAFATKNRTSNVRLQIE